MYNMGGVHSYHTVTLISLISYRSLKRYGVPNGKWDHFYQFIVVSFPHHPGTTCCDLGYQPSPPPVRVDFRVVRR